MVVTTVMAHVCAGFNMNARYLFLSSNRLSFLPKEIGLCTKLQVLDLRDNLLTHVPEEIVRCMALRELYLQKNLRLPTEMIKSRRYKK